MPNFEKELKNLTSILDKQNIAYNDNKGSVYILGKKDYDVTYNTNPYFLKGVGYYVTYVHEDGSEGTPEFAKDFKKLIDVLKRKGILNNTVTASTCQKYRFKDGFECTADSKEEAIQKHKQSKVCAASEEDLIKILKELGFVSYSWFYKIDLTKYKFETTSKNYRYPLILGVSIESDKFSRVFVYRVDKGKNDLLSVFVKNDKDFRKNIQKLIKKATQIAALFEEWCDKK